MKLTDEKLKQAAGQVAQTMGSMPLPSEEPTFSPVFEEKMTRLLRQQKRLKLWKRLACGAASILLLLVMTGTMVLTLNIEAQAIFQTWRRSVSAGRYTYRFTEDRRGQQLPYYEITKLPEGYFHKRTTRFENSALVSYQKQAPNAKYIDPLGLEYFWISDQVAMIVGEYGGHTVTAQQVTVNGTPAHLYEDINPSNGMRHYVLVWIDQDAGLVFRLGTCLTAEETIAAAESIHPIE